MMEENSGGGGSNGSSSFPPPSSNYSTNYYKKLDRGHHHLHHHSLQTLHDPYGPSALFAMNSQQPAEDQQQLPLPPSIDRTLIDSFVDGYQQEAMIAIAPDGSVSSSMIPIDSSAGGGVAYGSSHPPPPVSFFYPRFPIMHPYGNGGGGGGGVGDGMEPWEWKGYAQQEAALLPLPLGLSLGPPPFPANPTTNIPSHLQHHHLSPLVAAAAAVGITPAMTYSSNVTLPSGDVKDTPRPAPSTAAKERRR